MKPSLQPGLTANVSFEVTRERTIDFMGEKARVYATPMLVRTSTPARIRSVRASSSTTSPRR
jgi:predicted thioesterase